MTRCPFAIWRPGPAWKVNTALNTGDGAVLHSAEGSLNGAFGQLDSDTQVSWHFTISNEGTIYQHYDIEAQCWHARAAGNPYFIGIEHENQYTNGAPDHRPFTEEQVSADADLLDWLSGQLGWTTFAQRDVLWEHNWLTETACPSGRIPWDELYAMLEPVPLGEPVALDGWVKEAGPFWSLYNGGVPWPVFRIGSNDGSSPGRISKLFGQVYLWLRNDNGRAYWSEEEGD